MEQACEDNVIVLRRQPSPEWEDLIRKLRWIGLPAQARRLELAVSTLRPDESFPVGQFGAD